MQLVSPGAELLVTKPVGTSVGRVGRFCAKVGVGPTATSVAVDPDSSAITGILRRSDSDIEASIWSELSHPSSETPPLAVGCTATLNQSASALRPNRITVTPCASSPKRTDAVSGRLYICALLLTTLPTIACPGMFVIGVARLGGVPSAVAASVLLGVTEGVASWLDRSETGVGYGTFSGIGVVAPQLALTSTRTISPTITTRLGFGNRCRHATHTGTTDVSLHA